MTQVYAPPAKNLAEDAEIYVNLEHRGLTAVDVAISLNIENAYAVEHRYGRTRLALLHGDADTMKAVGTEMAK